MRALFALWLAALALPLSAEWRLETVRQSLTGSHCRYREYVDGVPAEEYVVRPCSQTLSQPLVSESVEPSSRARLIRANGRLLRREIVQERPLETFAYDYDVETSALVRKVPLFFNAKNARVFDPNPVASLNDPALQDRNDAAAAVPESAYHEVVLNDVEDSGPLRGPHATIVDRQAPSIAPPDAAASLIFNRQDDGFEDVNAYYHVDRNQQHLQALGYSGARSIVPYAIEIDAHAANGADNSYFIPSSTRIGYGTLYYGEGGTDDAEDADLVVHEYGHAILEWIAPGTFVGTYASESRALSEGFGDYWAYSAHAAQRIASGRDPFCFADWDARCWEDDASQQCGYKPGTDCLRRLDSTLTMADYDRAEASGVEHHNGTIWSSALREIHQQLGRDTTDAIVIESLFDTPPHPTYAVAAQRLIEADRLLFGGAHANTICGAMTSRGILTQCNAEPRGSETLFQSSEHGIAIPENNSEGVTSTLTITDPRTIEQLGVRIDIDHPTRGDLRIDLVAPDGTSVMLQQVSFEQTSGIHTTFGITAASAESLDIFRGRSAAGTWKLVVRDLRFKDAGTIVSWGLVLRFTGDAPLSERPRNARSRMIPVVAHLYGAGATPFVSDVRIANVTATTQQATLVFTHSGADGTRDFAATNVVIAPGATVSFDDVVDSAFHTVGSGTLEVLGDVIVMSRLYARTDGGTVGQQVPPVDETTGAGEAPLLVASFESATDRVNFGIAETAGGSGVVRVDDREVPILPFSHLQFPVTAGVTRVSVESGDARVAAYLSEVNGASSDAMFIPAEKVTSARTRIAPAISASGIGGSEWRSDLWFGSETMNYTAVPMTAVAGGESFAQHITFNRWGSVSDVLATFFERSIALAALRVELPSGTFGATRIRNGAMSEFVPLMSPEAPAEQQLLFVESSGPFRTNIGIVADEPAFAQLIVYDAAGVESSRTTLATSGGVAQRAVPPGLTGGRATVRFLTGHGRAYVSLVDGRTGDATWVSGH